MQNIKYAEVLIKYFHASYMHHTCIIHDDNYRPRFEIQIHMNDDAQLINARLCLKTTGLVNLRENKILVYV